LIDAKDPARLTPFGTTSLGTKVSVNSTFMRADLKILTGDVGYHQFCGYGGGGKSICPGLASADAIRENHSRLGLPGTGPGRLKENPVRAEIDEVDRLYKQSVPEAVDLVIASPGGFPRDATLYQAQKAISVAVRLTKSGGTVLVLAGCSEGSGSERFEAWMEKARTPQEVVNQVRENFEMGGHKAYQIARDARKASIHLFSMLPAHLVEKWFMRPVKEKSAIDRLIDKSERVIVLPQATLMLADVEPEGK
jgi:nickel-dependent lactate racemase